MAEFDFSNHSSGDVVAAYTLHARRLRAKMTRDALSGAWTMVRNGVEAVRMAFRIPNTEIL